MAMNNYNGTYTLRTGHDRWGRPFRMKRFDKQMLEVIEPEGKIARINRMIQNAVLFFKGESK